MFFDINRKIRSSSVWALVCISKLMCFWSIVFFIYYWKVPVDIRNWMITKITHTHTHTHTRTQTNTHTHKQTNKHTDKHTNIFTSTIFQWNQVQSMKISGNLIVVIPRWFHKIWKHKTSQNTPIQTKHTHTNNQTNERTNGRTNERTNSYGTN